MQRSLKPQSTGQHRGDPPPFALSSAKFVPWKIKLYVAFETIEQAQHFEKYLKSGSGHVFAKRHLWIIQEMNPRS
jgi:hypothetical protein